MGIEMKFIGAVLILSGMIIGAGIFAIPFSFVRAGFFIGMAELAVLTAVVVVLHRAYGEIVLATENSHRLPGYVRLYLGRRFAAAAHLSAFFGMSGTLLAYVVLGGHFLHTIIPAVSATRWTFLFLTAGALITFLPRRKEALVNGILTAVLIIFIFTVSIWLMPRIEANNFFGVHPGELFVPYGVLLFALSGALVIPDMVSFLGRRERQVRAAITAGSLIPVALYGLFAIAVVGAAGADVSEEAIAGLGRIAGSGMVMIGSGIGFLAVFTSFILLSSSFQAFLHLDFKMSKSWAHPIVSFLPAFLYILGAQNFIAIVAAVGAVAIGADAAFILAAERALKKSRRGHLSRWSYVWSGGVYCMIAAGITYQVYAFIFL